MVEALEDMIVTFTWYAVHITFEGEYFSWKLFLQYEARRTTGRSGRSCSTTGFKEHFADRWCVIQVETQSLVLVSWSQQTAGASADI